MAADSMSSSLKGRILLQVESKGEAWYVDPSSGNRVYLGRPADAFAVMRSYGLGISNADLAKIAAPNEKDKDLSFAKKLAGRIVIAVQANGEAYYINPLDFKKYYLGRPSDAFALMRSKGLGITNANLNKIPSAKSTTPTTTPTTTPDEKTKPTEESTTTTEESNNTTENPVATSTENTNVQPKESTTSEEVVSSENLAWRGSEKIASNRYVPQAYYSPKGDLWIFYADKYNNLYYRVRRSNEVYFNNEVLLVNNAQKAHPWFDAQGDISKLAVSGNGQTHIMETFDNGNSWRMIKTYLNQDSSCSPSYPEAIITGENGNVLVFNYKVNTQLFGCAYKIRSVVSDGSTWGNDVKDVGDGILAAAYATGQKITIVGSNWMFQSLDGGSNYSEIRGGDTTETRLGSQSAMFINGKVFLGRSYSYGPESEANKHLGIVLGGSDLSSPERILIQSSNSYYRNFQITGSANIFLATWTSMGANGRLKGSLSYDNGKTWTDAFDIARAATGYEIPFPVTEEDVGLKATSLHGNMAVVYSTQKGTASDIYLAEYR